MKKQVELIEWLDERGFGIFREVQVDGSDGEYILARAIIMNGSLEAFEEIMKSKFQHRLITRYNKELQTNKEVIMDIMETIKDLTIEELESLLPSYYQLAIERRIKELKSKPVVDKTTEDAVTKTKRSRKKTTKTTSRSRNLS